jgi:hypothetical protein
MEGWKMEGWKMEDGRWKMEDGRWKMALSTRQDSAPVVAILAVAFQLVPRSLPFWRWLPN